MYELVEAYSQSSVAEGRGVGMAGAVEKQPVGNSTPDEDLGSTD